MAVEVVADLDLAGRTAIATVGLQRHRPRDGTGAGCSDESAERLWATSEALPTEA